MINSNKDDEKRTVYDLTVSFVHVVDKSLAATAMMLLLLLFVYIYGIYSIRYYA